MLYASCISAMLFINSAFPSVFVFVNIKFIVLAKIYNKKIYNKKTKKIKKNWKNVYYLPIFEEDVYKAKLDYKNRLKILTDSLDYLTMWYETRIFEDNLISPEDFCNMVDKVDKQSIVEQARKFIMTTKYVLEGVD